MRNYGPEETVSILKDITNQLKFRNGKFYGFLSGNAGRKPDLRYFCQINFQPLKQSGYGEYHPSILLEGFSAAGSRYMDIAVNTFAPKNHPGIHHSIYLETHLEPERIDGTLTFDRGRFFRLNLDLGLKTPQYEVIKVEINGRFQFRIPFAGIRINPNSFFPKPDTEEKLTRVLAEFVDLVCYLPPRSHGKLGWKLSQKISSNSGP